MIFINKYMASLLLIILRNNIQLTTQSFQGNNPMVLCEPWYDSYLYNWGEPQNFNHQTLMTFAEK